MALTIRSREDAVKLGPLAVAAWDEHVHAATPKQSVKTASGKGLQGQSSAERRFDDRYLTPMWDLGQIHSFEFIGKNRRFHSFVVAGKKRYTPDYLVRTCRHPIDGAWEHAVYIEVKGRYSGKGSISQVQMRYRDSLTRLEVVAKREPYVFLLAEYRGKEGWKITRIPGAGDLIKLNGLFGVE